ncbi:non-hydrolyzing UDP-N-acetylglucosamine 2-epimerase [Isoptericola sp. NPDC057391]|uniref:non-hydrolyzing UDP-N-acetylglucosamine 2-epimerase n=1 Tax=Isoptericola sp. NPDC057391 TaxID=3346117 RepID=UPI00363215D9
MTVYGTRPEAIKVAPVIQELQRSDTLSAITVVTGQHREMLDQVNHLFGIVPDHDLDIFEHGASLSRIVSRVLDRIDPVLEAERPAALIVQGDTSTSAAAALGAFHHGIPVVHLEAGLRSGDLRSPFPEEANRRLTSQLASLHLAPTAASRANLVREAISEHAVVVTGNTVIDALLTAAGKASSFSDPVLERVTSGSRRIVLVTTHRRENWGTAMQGIGRALASIADAFPDVEVVVPLHRNPVVREALAPHLDGRPNVTLVEPLAYAEFTRLLALASVVLTDSGGIQEEAPSLGKPVLVLRENTERPEAVAAGTVRLIGTDTDTIVHETSILLSDPAAYEAMARATNPYGDGRGAFRSVAAITHMLGLGDRPADWVTEGRP